MAEDLDLGPGSRAVLIGTRTYEHLTDLPAVKESVTDLGELLAAQVLWGNSGLGLRTAFDPATADAFYGMVQEAAQNARDTLLIHYSGHGLVDPRSGELYLAVPGSSADRPFSTAFPYEWLRVAVSESAASRRVVVLDCCYSGRAVGTMASDGFGPTDIDRTYVLTATSANRQAMSPPGEMYTALTGELITLLSKGIPGAGSHLTLNQIQRAASDALRAKGRPPPHSRDANAMGELPFVRNAAVSGKARLVPTVSPVRTAPPGPRELAVDLPVRITGPPPPLPAPPDRSTTPDRWERPVPPGPLKRRHPPHPPSGRCLRDRLRDRLWRPAGGALAVLLLLSVSASSSPDALQDGRPVGLPATGGPAHDGPHTAGAQPPGAQPPGARSADPRTADPCALLDATALDRFGASRTDPAYAAPARCDVLVTPSLGPELDVEATFSPVNPSEQPSAPQERHSGVVVTYEVSDGSECDRDLALPGGTYVNIAAKPSDSGNRLEPRALCDLADAATDHAVEVLKKGVVPRRPAPVKPALAAFWACPLVRGAASLREFIGSAPRLAPGWADWDCDVSGGGPASPEVRVAFNQGQPRVDGTPVRLGGRQAYIGSDDDSDDSCTAAVVYRVYQRPTDGDIAETVRVHLAGPGTKAHLCASARALGAVVAQRLPKV